MLMKPRRLRNDNRNHLITCIERDAIWLDGSVGGWGMLTIVVRSSLTVFGGITMLSIGPSPIGSAWITSACMDLASCLVLSGMGGGLRGGGAATLLTLGGDGRRILSLPILYGMQCSV